MKLQQLLFLILLTDLIGLPDHRANAETAVEVAVSTAAGNQIQGDLLQISEQGVQLRRDSIELLPIDALSAINFPNLAKPSLPTVVELSGGSKIHVSSVTWDGEKLELTPSRQPKLELPIAQLKSVRYRPGNAATDAVWLGWGEESRRGDRLAVRRDERTLDSLDGTVVGITRDTIQFNMGGNTIDAPIAKLEGVLFSATAGESASEGVRVNDTSGSQYVAQFISLVPGADHLQLTLMDSVQHSVPIDQLVSVQFAGGILRLSDAEVASSRFASTEASGQKTALDQSLQAWFSPRAAAPGENGSDGVITMSSPGEISFRVPPGYGKLVAAVRRRADVNLFTPVTAEVLVDGEPKWTGDLRDREALGLDLSVDDARLVTLKVSENLSGGNKSDGQESRAAAPGLLGGAIEWFGGRLLK